MKKLFWPHLTCFKCKTAWYQEMLPTMDGQLIFVPLSKLDKELRVEKMLQGVPQAGAPSIIGAVIRSSTVYYPCSCYLYIY